MPKTSFLNSLKQKVKLDPIYQLIIVIGIIVLIIATTIKIMHWPNSFEFYMVGYLLIILTYPRIILRKKKKSIFSIFRVIVIMVWGFANILYLMNYPDYKNLFNVISKIGLVTWGLLYLYEYFMYEKEKASVKSKVVTAIFILGGLMSSVGLIHKLLHLPNATALLFIGVALIGFWAIASAFLDIDENKMI